MTARLQHIQELSARTLSLVVQEQQARLRVRDQRQRFFQNPVNLLLPFSTGMLVAARFSRSRGTRQAARKTVWLQTLVSAGSTAYKLYNRYMSDIA